MLPVLLHLPHAAQDIPPPYRSDYLLSDAQLRQDLIRLTDLYTDELYELPGASRAVFPVSRFLVDPERFADDAQESMAARGMGVLYTVTTDMQPLRLIPTAERRTELLTRYYIPHHASLDAWADEALRSAGRGLLMDCHSYPSRPLPYELENMQLSRPEIGIGTDPFHTPREIAQAVVEAFRRRGYEVGLDSPFSGTLTPAAHYHRSKNIMAFMIEVRKDLYVDEQSGEKLAAFARVKADLSAVMSEAASLAADVKL